MALGPTARLGLRQAFNPLRWVPLLPLVILESDLPAIGRAERISTFLLCCAAPQTVGYLLELEHTGRLDQMRLAGRTPVRIALSIAAAVGGPWIVGGLVLLAWSIAFDTRLNAPMVTAALVGAPTALAALASTGIFQRQRVDPRIVIVGLGFIGVSFGILGQLQFWSMRGSMTAVAAYPVIVEAAIIAVCLRGLIRRIAYPLSTRTKTGTTFQFRLGRRTMRLPAMYRGAVLAASGYALAVVFAPMILLLRELMGVHAPPALIAFSLPPLIIGALVISLICREDAVSGRLDIVRQAAMPPWIASVQMMAGLWAPFLIAAAVLWQLSWWLWGIPSQEHEAVRAVSLALLLAAPLPLVEGWGRHWVLTISLPYALAILVSLRADAFLSVGVLGALLWWAAARRFRDSDRPVLWGWQAAAILALLAALPWRPGVYPPFAVLAAGGALIAISPLILTDTFKRRDFWITTAAVAAAATVAAGPRFGWRGSPGAGLAVAIAWVVAVRLRQSGALATAAQGAVRFVGIVLFAVLMVDENITGFRADDGVSFVITAVGLLLIVETGLRVRALLKWVATPRA